MQFSRRAIILGSIIDREALAHVSKWTILCDFDGTISVEDVFDSLLDHYGLPGWRALENDWVAGRIGSRACMQGQVRLLQMRPAELDRHLDALWIDHAFPAFVADARALGVPLRVVSDGLDYAIDHMLENSGVHGLPIVANHLVPPADPSADRGWQLDTQWQAAGCRAGVCKCMVAEQARKAAPKVLLIGDGASDFCVANRVDFVFAKGRLIEHCRALGVPYMPITGFEDARKYLPQLLAGTLQDAGAAPVAQAA